MSTWFWFLQPMIKPHQLIICPMPSSDYSMMLILLLHMVLKIAILVISIRLIPQQGFIQMGQVAQSSIWVLNSPFTKFCFKAQKITWHSKLIGLPYLCYLNLKFKNQLFLMHFYFIVPHKKATYFPICRSVSLFSLLTKLSYKIREMKLLNFTNFPFYKRF